jgi:hypothetical protein
VSPDKSVIGNGVLEVTPPFARDLTAAIGRGRPSPEHEREHVAGGG